MKLSERIPYEAEKYYFTPQVKPLITAWVDEVATLEQRVERLREALHEIAHGQHSGRGYANQVLSETGTLAAKEDLSTLPTQQKLTEEDMERN